MEREAKRKRTRFERDPDPSTHSQHAFLTDQDGARHRINKTLLASKSQFFKALFSYSPNDETEFKLGTVKRTTTGLHQSTATGLAAVLYYLETGQFHLGEDSVLEVLQSAEYLGEQRLSNLCQQWLVARLEPGNALGFWQCGQELFLSRLQADSWSFLASRVEEVFREEEFLQLAAASLKMLLESDDLCSSEEQVWEALERWCKAGPDRQAEGSAMVAAVRLELLDSYFFKRNVRPHVLLLGLLPAEIDQARLTVSRPRTVANLVVVGGWQGSARRGMPSSAVHIYTPGQDTWSTLPTQVPAAGNMGSGALGGEVYMCGGRGSRVLAMNEVSSITPATCSVRRVSNMRVPRTLGASAVLGSSLYVLGGLTGTWGGGREVLASVEEFRPLRNQWNFLRRMIYKRSEAGAAELGGKIYVVGGTDGLVVHNSVERLDPKTGRWSLVRPMGQARAGAAVAALAGRLCVVGGRSAGSSAAPLRCGEVYCPKADEWTALPDMIHPRSNFGLVVLAGRLTAVGGDVGGRETAQVETLDLSRGRWSQLAPLPAAYSGLSAVTMPPALK